MRINDGRLRMTTELEPNLRKFQILPIGIKKFLPAPQGVPVFFSSAIFRALVNVNKTLQNLRQ